MKLLSMFFPEGMSQHPLIGKLGKGKVMGSASIIIEKILSPWHLGALNSNMLVEKLETFFFVIIFKSVQCRWVQKMEYALKKMYEDNALQS